MGLCVIQRSASEQKLLAAASWQEQNMSENQGHYTVPCGAHLIFPVVLGYTLMGYMFFIVIIDVSYN